MASGCAFSQQADPDSLASTVPSVVQTQKYCKKTPPSTLFSPLATTMSLGEVRGHYVPFDVGFSAGTQAVSWLQGRIELKAGANSFAKSPS